MAAAGHSDRRLSRRDRARGRCEPVVAGGNPISDAAITAAKAAETAGGAGANKKAAVVAAVVPLIPQEALKGGVTEPEADAEPFAGMVVEEVVATLKSTPFDMFAGAVLHLIGVNT